MDTNWSRQLAERFHLNLPDDVIAWLDSEIWREETWLGFGYPQRPADIAHSVWGGQMLPDTLPILGNGGGDQLCLRIHPDGSLREVLAWFHEGSFWVPYGDTLCEALLFNAALGLKTDAADAELEDPSHDLLLFAAWALERLQGQATPQGIMPQGLSLESLLQSGLAETAVRRELCKEHWASGLLRHCRQIGGGVFAEKLGIGWPEFSRWLVDTAFIPDRYKSKLARITRLPVEQLLRQDWDEASQEAHRVSELRSDLLWPYAVMGQAAERQGHRDVAASHYYSGLKTLESSADFTHDWVTDRRANVKYPLERLRALRSALPGTILEDGYLQAALDAQTGAECASAIRGYWMKQGEEAEAQGRPDRAYWCYYSAGWDLFCFDHTSTILARLQRAAQAAGWTALAHLAGVHLEQVSRLQ